MSVASLPDDVVLLIIDACDLLEKDRGKTLAALCRLAKRYKAAAERALYSRVKLRTHWEPQPVVPGTALHTLVQESRLRASVKSIILRIPDEHAQDPQVASLLEDLPNVEEILLGYRATQADAQVFSQNNVRIRSLRTQSSFETVGKLLQDHAAAFAGLSRLDLRHLPASANTLSSFAAITSLSLGYVNDPGTFATVTSPFSAGITTLRLPLKADMAGDSLAGFHNLKHLSLVGYGLTVESLELALPRVSSILGQTSSLTSFVSLAVEGVLFAADRSPATPRTSAPARRLYKASPSQVPASSKVILAAIPSQIQHLSLVTSCLLADDVATYVLGPSRPPALMTLRLGGAVGQGFKEFARTKSAWYADFERTMEEAGVELTTVG